MSILIFIFAGSVNDFDKSFKELDEYLHEDDLTKKWNIYRKEIDKKYVGEIRRIIQKGKLMMQENNQKHGVKKIYSFDDYNFNFDDDKLIEYYIRKKFIDDFGFMEKHEIGENHN